MTQALDDPDQALKVPTGDHSLLVPIGRRPVFDPVPECVQELRTGGSSFRQFQSVIPVMQPFYELLAASDPTPGMGCGQGKDSTSVMRFS